MQRRIQAVDYIVASRGIQLKINVKQGTYTVNLTTQLINETVPDMNMTAEKLAIYLSNLPNQRLNETLQLQENQLSILVATLGKYRKIYLKCPISIFQPFINSSVQSQHQNCKKARLASEKKLRELDDDTFQLKILVEHLNNKVASQEEKLTQTLNYVKHEIENYKREYMNKISELSIMISEQKSSELM